MATYGCEVWDAHNMKDDCYVLLTAHPNITIVFFTNLLHKFFILIHLLHSSTCIEHYCAHIQEDKLY